MTEVVAAVLTFRRPEFIAALVPVLVAEVRSLGAGWTGTVLVVDNDPAASAREVVERAAGGGPVRYVHEPIPGIAAGRNRAMAESASARLLAFVDDDGVPVAGWLAALVRTFETYDAAAVQGAVVARYEVPPTGFVAAGGFFDRPRFPTGTPLRAAAAGDLLLDLDRVREWGLEFPAEFGLTGGEDTALTSMITARGGRIVFCDEAVVEDFVPAARMNRRYLIGLAFHIGNVEVRVAESLAPGGLGRAGVRARFAVGGVARLVLGTGRWAGAAAARRPRSAARGAWTAARGRGMIAGVVGRVHGAYLRAESPGH